LRASKHAFEKSCAVSRVGGSPGRSLRRFRSALLGCAQVALSVLVICCPRVALGRASKVVAPLERTLCGVAVSSTFASHRRYSCQDVGRVSARQFAARFRPFRTEAAPFNVWCGDLGRSARISFSIVQNGVRRLRALKVRGAPSGATTHCSLPSAIWMRFDGVEAWRISSSERSPSARRKIVRETCAAVDAHIEGVLLVVFELDPRPR